MTYKEFIDWCSKRTNDGCWGMTEAMACVAILQIVRKQRFWKRNRFWRREYEQRVLKEIVNPISEKLNVIRSMNKVELT